MRARLEMNPTARIAQRLGLDKDGRAQKFHTQNVLRRIQKYMPYRTGATIRLTIAQTNISSPEIVTDTPYAKYLYYGKAMAGRAPKAVTDRNLSYTKTKNPLAGPFWDRTLSTAEGAVMARELEDYIRRGGSAG